RLHPSEQVRRGTPMLAPQRTSSPGDPDACTPANKFAGDPDACTPANKFAGDPDALRGWGTRVSGGGAGSGCPDLGGGYGCRDRGRGVFGGLPVAQATAEQTGGAALTAEDDNIVLQGEVRVPGHEF